MDLLTCPQKSRTQASFYIGRIGRKRDLPRVCTVHGVLEFPGRGEVGALAGLVPSERGYNAAFEDCVRDVDVMGGR